MKDNLLLDTHTLIWFAKQNNLISEKANHEIKSADRVYVSIVSYWEIAIKLNLKKIEMDMSLKDLMNETLKHRIELLTVTPSHILAIEKLVLHHRDPFDRMLVAQAKSEKLTLVSRDSILDKYKIKRVW